MQEVFVRRNESSFLNEQLEQFEEQIQGFNKSSQNVDHITEEIHSARELLKTRDQEVFNLQFRLNSALEDTQAAIKQLNEKLMQEVTIMV